MILVNGKAADSLPAGDRGVAYGDGVFRTLAVTGGKPSVWSRQYAKLERDCRALRILCPPEPALGADLLRIAARTPECAVKIIITRGQSGRGYAVQADTPPLRIVMSFPLPNYPREHYQDGVRVRLCTLRLGAQPALAGIKHLNRLENVLARMEWNDPQTAEGLLLDGGDRVTSGTMTNLFLVRNGGLVTPDLSRCGVAGVTRDRIIELAAKRRLRCEIASVSLEQLMAADEVLLVNSLIGVWQVRELAGRIWRPGTMSATIRRWLDEKIS